MKRGNKHKSKEDEPQPSTSRPQDEERHDLHQDVPDRVKLIQDVFSTIPPKQIKAMIPDCLKKLSLKELKEICTDELLGISDKRLHAIIDGVEPPSDTESSNSLSEQTTVITLDSISSEDEETVRPTRRKHKKHKHKRKSKKSKKKNKDKRKRRCYKKNDDSSADGSSVDGSSDSDHSGRKRKTMLDVLQRQARATALRGHLDSLTLEINESTITTSAGTSIVTSTTESSTAQAASVVQDSDVEELIVEPINVVEISSEDEKPDVEQLKVGTSHEAIKEQENPKTGTKHVNDLVITVPQTKQTRKIKLIRNTEYSCEMPQAYVCTENNNKVNQNLNSEKIITVEDHKNKKPKKKNKKKVNNKKGSDHDEITLQLSDTEKMDLLENLDGNHYDNVSSSSKDLDEDSCDTIKSSNKASHLDVSVHQKIENKLETIDIPINTDKNTIETVNSNDKKHYNEDSPNVDEVLKHNNENLVETSQVTEDILLSETVTELADIDLTVCKLDDNKTKLTEGELLDRAYYEVERNDFVCVSDNNKTEKENDEDFVNNDDFNEIFELSDDSSCYEVEGVSVLSNEPTTHEIEALSAKVDDATREDINDDAKEYEKFEESNAENISWKDRYLGSTKVKRVLKTSNILNALRRKNKELKKKIEESKKINPLLVEKDKFEGTLDEYNSLEGSCKFVAPVSDKSNDEEKDVKEVKTEMNKDAKQLLKMYKMLLKYNDMNKKKDPERKKVKKSKKKNKVKK